jgi:hypothetical protein
MISATRSRSGSSCLANCSGISMVNCTKPRLVQAPGRVNPRANAPPSLRPQPRALLEPSFRATAYVAV